MPEPKSAEEPKPAEASPAEAPRKKCPDCDEAGKTRCTVCSGLGRVPAPCGACGGTGKQVCSSCARGRVPCTKCGGTGRREVIPVGPVRRGEKSYTACPRFQLCGICRGSGRLSCSFCAGKGTASAECVACTGKGKVGCLSCGGAAWIPDPEAMAAAEARRAAAAQIAEAAASSRGRLLAAEGETARCLKRLDELKAAGGKASKSFEALRTKMAGLPAMEMGSSTLQVLAKSLADEWESCQKSRAKLSEKLAEVDALAAKSALHTADIRVLARQTEEGSPPGEDALKLHEGYASEFKGSLERLEGTIEYCSGLLEACGKEASSLEAKFSAQTERDARKRQDDAAKAEAFRRVQGELPRIADVAGLQGAEGQLLAAQSKSPQELFIEVSHFDRENAAGDGEGVPRDEVMERIPALVTKVFDACPEVAKVRVRLDGLVVGETGHEERRTLQSFTMEAPRWKELVTGKFRDDWRILLAKSRPVPDYPRSGSSLPEGWAIIALGIISVLALAVLYVLRSKLMLR